MALSPMMQQYFKIKDQYQDAILFYRLGDFYEMFFDDAITASRELELTLTGRDCGLEERAPMCGVPFHAVDVYLAKLIEKGYKVAICEQITKPGDQKGIVKRQIVREVTPGTKIDSTMLEDDKNNYLASVYKNGDKVGVSWFDISTGEFNHAEIDGQIHLKLNELLSRIEPSEIICNSEMLDESNQLSLVKYGDICKFSLHDDNAFSYDNAYENLSKALSNLDIFDNKPLCVQSAGALLDYIHTTQKRTLSHINMVSDEICHMSIDMNARRTLELTSSITENKKRGSLLWLMDKTSTSMGKRKLLKWIESPLYDEKEINLRLDAVELLTHKVILRDGLHELLSQISDIERLVGRISYGNVSPRDCIALKNSLALNPQLKKLLSQLNQELLNQLNNQIDNFDDIVQLLEKGIVDNPSLFVRDGGVIKDGFDEQLDEYRNISTNSKQILDKIEATEKAATNIKNLKIGYNRVFGYYLEVPKSQLELVPYRYVRKQTIASGERYVTDELKQIETKILDAETLSIEREQALFENIITKLKQYLSPMLRTADSIAYLDCLVSNSIIAMENNYVRPIINSSLKHIKIVEGRHPVVEKILKGESYVPNDVFLDEDENKTVLITGPNMAGKSVFMRQVALITIMAHMGSYVPASKAEIALTDKIFTRVGASDDLSTGRSTFMVEMSEVAFILHNATNKSLLLLDEIGRGTATYDGLSIAWAIIQYLSNKLTCKTLFSTHYHELTELECQYKGVKNYKMTVKEINNSIVFLRKLMRGSANKSFGIEVASLAGLPDEVVTIAKGILKKIENNDLVRKNESPSSFQMSMYGNNTNNEIITILRELNIDDVTPRHALDILSDLKEKLENE